MYLAVTRFQSNTNSPKIWLSMFPATLKYFFFQFSINLGSNESNKNHVVLLNWPMFYWVRSFVSQRSRVQIAQVCVSLQNKHLSVLPE